MRNFARIIIYLEYPAIKLMSSKGCKHFQPAFLCSSIPSSSFEVGIFSVSIPYDFKNRIKSKLLSENT